MAFDSDRMWIIFRDTTGLALFRTVDLLRENYKARFEEKMSGKK